MDTSDFNNPSNIIDVFVSLLLNYTKNTDFTEIQNVHNLYPWLKYTYYILRQKYLHYL